MNSPRIVFYQVALALILLCGAPAATSQVNVVITGDDVVVEINLLGIGADFSIHFDDPQNLTVPALGIGVQLVSPLSRDLRARMPPSRGGLTLALPLIISVDPPAKHGLAFSNVTEIELHTHLLPFQIDSPLRLYKSDNGGPFYDITTDIQPGSVRTRGRTGGFSDFLLVVDLTPPQVAAEDKYAFLEETLYAVPHYGVRFQLERDLALSRSAFRAGNFADARLAMEVFEDRVRKNAGTAIPNRWRAQRDLDNVAGDLLSEAGSLRYMLIRLGG